MAQRLGAAGADRVQRLLGRSPLGGDGLDDAADVGHRALELRDAARRAVAREAAAGLVPGHADVVATGRRHQAAEAVAEADLAGAMVEDVVAAARSGAVEVGDLVPA